MINGKKNHHYIIQIEKKAIGHLALMHKNSDSFEITIVIGEKEYKFLITSHKRYIWFRYDPPKFASGKDYVQLYHQQTSHTRRPCAKLKILFNTKK